MNAAEVPDRSRLLGRIALVGCACMLAITLSSAYLRLTAAGMGCSPWPQCYGWLDLAPAQGIDVASAVGIARLLHRVSAMAVAVISVLVLLLTLAAVRTLGNVAAALALCALTVLLALVGRQTPGTVVPLVGMINLSGGFAMLALYALLWMTNRQPVHARSAPSAIAWLIFVLTLVQITTGALASVTYSAPACIGVLDCGVEPKDAWASLMTLAPTEPLQVDANGRVFMPGAAAALQWIHRVCGLALAVTMLLHALALRAGRDPNARTSRWIAVIAAAEVLAAVTMVVVRFPLFAAILHNLLAALLLLAVLASITMRRPVG